MKITINESEDIEDLEIVVNCKRVDENLLKMIDAIRAFDRKIKGTRDGKLFVLDVDAIYYFESVDKKTFIYLDKDVYESSLRLYELEEKFVDAIYYFESVDKKTFIYLDKDVYESSLRLYELEEKFVNTDFFRASKSTIINLSKIKVITPIFGGKLEVLLENNEKLVVSRQYVPLLKRKLNF